jgi:pyruvate/2-oxoglutarate dehydrogenase complex dihydrolipoamide dehydrogenase (E3) component
MTRSIIGNIRESRKILEEKGYVLVTSNRELDRGRFACGDVTLGNHLQSLLERESVACEYHILPTDSKSQKFDIYARPLKENVQATKIVSAIHSY